MSAIQYYRSTVQATKIWTLANLPGMADRSISLYFWFGTTWVAEFVNFRLRSSEPLLLPPLSYEFELQLAPSVQPTDSSSPVMFETGVLTYSSTVRSIDGSDNHVFSPGSAVSLADWLAEEKTYQTSHLNQYQPVRVRVRSSGEWIDWFYTSMLLQD